MKAPFPAFINYDMDEAAYHAIDACSSHRLSYMLKSPAHARWAIDHPEAPKPAMILGSAVDCLVLTSMEFDSRYAIVGPCEATTAKGKPCDNDGKYLSVDEHWYCGTHFKNDQNQNSNLTVLSKHDWETAHAMQESIYRHDDALALLSACDHFQASLFWDYGGMPAKSRLDAVAWDLDGGTIIDLKTTIDASPECFEKAIYNFGYHRQGAFYRHAAEQCGRQIKNFAIIAVEKDPPYVVAVYRLKDIALHCGWMQIQPLLAKYYDCWKSGKWPGFPGITDIGIPHWSEKQIERSMSA